MNANILMPAGFRAAGVCCGIKSDSQREDLSLIHAPQGAVAAGVYTQNIVCAAPVVVDRQRTPSSDVRVVVVNSGNANACTGDRGYEDALVMARLAAEACGAEEEQTLVMSTGMIGQFLPMEKIAAGIASAADCLANSPAALLNAARGIMTTDAYHKLASSKVALSAGDALITGIAKGAAMIGPRMATMLSVLMTDAKLTPTDAQTMLQRAVDSSFNRISVEGHASTNDTVLLLASGASGKQLAGEDLKTFEASLSEVCIELARMIPNDGEGASHLITIDVIGCASQDDALRIARTIADSALVKTAVAGGDPNWGRIVSAAGYAGVNFDPTQVDLYINEAPIYKSGSPLAFDAAAVSASMRAKRDTHIAIHFSEGPERTRFWTSDLTVEYVKFNANYTT